MRIRVFAIAALVLCSCHDEVKPTPGETAETAMDPCVAQALKEVHASEDIARKVGGNINAALKIINIDAGASSDQQFKSKMDAAFQAVPDSAAVCQIVAKTETCAIKNDKDAVAMKLVDVLNEKCK